MDKNIDGIIEAIASSRGMTVDALKELVMVGANPEFEWELFVRRVEVALRCVPLSREAFARTN